MKSLLSIFAGSNGKTALIAVHATLGVLTFLGLEIWQVVVKGTPFDMSTFATALGIALAASAAAIGGHDYLASKADAIPNPPAGS